MKTIILLLLTLTSFASAQDQYQLIQPEKEVYTDLRQTLTIVANHAVEIGDIKPHPKITWLDRSAQRTINATIHTELGFILRAPGIIKFPPIPVLIENKSFFLRLDDITAKRNPAPKDLGQLHIIWNGQLEMPKTLHLGEILEIDYLAQLPDNHNTQPQFDLIPINAVLNAKWHLFSRQRGRAAKASDYFFDFNQSSAFRARRYVSRDGNSNGKPVTTRQYKSRLICSELGKVSGHLGTTLAITQKNENQEFVKHQRTYLHPFHFTVLPIPPIPNDRLINTGLVGDWEIKAAITPSTPVPNQPLNIQLDLTGKGDPTLRREFDFSRDGFASVESEMLDASGTNYTTWAGRFTQTLIPSGNIAAFPATTLATFDTVNDRWKTHPINPSMNLLGKSDTTRHLTPLSQLRTPVIRPILLNLPRLIFPIVALAPFLPLLLNLLKKRLDQRDPIRKERQQKIRALIKHLHTGKGSPETIDDQLLPLLRAHLQLPPGASTREVADTLKTKHRALSSLLHNHSKASFSSGSSAIDLKDLATKLAKISFIILLTGQLRATTLQEANLAFSQDRFSQALTAYQTLIEKNPGQPRLHHNLALTHLAIDQPARARAACHTALLLSPLDRETRALMDDIRQRLGAPALPGTRLLALRPDHWFILAAALWVLAFTLLGLRHFQPKIPRLLAILTLLLATLFLATGAWRNTHAYADQQFMIIGDDLPREPTPGIPDWDFPTLKNGLIIKAAEITQTHVRIEADNTSFWLPLSQLQQVW